MTGGVGAEVGPKRRCLDFFASCRRAPGGLEASVNQGFIALRNGGKWHLLNSHVLSARAPNQIGGTSGGIKSKAQ